MNLNMLIPVGQSKRYVGRFHTPSIKSAIHMRPVPLQYIMSQQVRTFYITRLQMNAPGIHINIAWSNHGTRKLGFDDRNIYKTSFQFCRFLSYATLKYDLLDIFGALVDQ